MAAAGLPVAIAGDEERDGFPASGDNDMLDIFRSGVRIPQPDHPLQRAPSHVGPIPGAIVGRAHAGQIRKPGSADLIQLTALSLGELVARPHCDRIVLKAGRRITTTVPLCGDLTGETAPW